MYEFQLNGNALIADRVGLGPVNQVALVYTEPVTDGYADLLDEARTEDGFRMGFHAKVVPVDPDRSKIPPLLPKARGIYDVSAPSSAAKGCEDWANFDTLVKASRTWC